MKKFGRIENSIINLSDARRIEMFNNGTPKNSEWQIRLTYGEYDYEFLKFGKGEDSRIRAEKAMDVIFKTLNNEDA
jgi:hypothetical protein